MLVDFALRSRRLLTFFFFEDTCPHPVAPIPPPCPTEPHARLHLPLSVSRSTNGINLPFLGGIHTPTPKRLKVPHPSGSNGTQLRLYPAVPLGL